MTTILIKVAIRLVVFTGVFWLVARRDPKVVFEKKWAPPLVGLVFAVLSTALYWAVGKVLAIATLGVAGFALPLVINVLLLAATVRVFQSKQWFRIEGFFAFVWMALFLTLAHGALWLGMDYIPAHT
jgi:uncharacterized membrane protein YvlD (DUF360 family)